MIIQCAFCNKWFDDEYRDTGCPHDTFSANDGNNNFAHNDAAYLSDNPPSDPNVITALADRFDGVRKDEYASPLELLNQIAEIDPGAGLQETRLVSVIFSDGSVTTLTPGGSPVVTLLKVSQIAGVDAPDEEANDAMLEVTKDVIAENRS